jgi:hypothetical protein
LTYGVIVLHRFRVLGLLFSILTGVSLAGAAPLSEPDPLPARTPPTAGSLYRLLFELEQGLPFRDFLRKVPNSYVIREPRDIVEACRRLSLRAEHRKANWNALLQLEGPFLARDNEQNWLLYEVEGGKVYRLEPGNKEPVPVAQAEFLKHWSRDIVEVAKVPAPAEKTDGPRIRFAETKHDFGEVWQGDKLEHRFVFENVGSATLEIKGVRANCGCTAALLGRMVEGTISPDKPASDKRFAPGEFGHVKVVLNTKGKRNRAHSSVTVTTNDTTSASVRLAVNAKVKIAVDIQPTIVHYGRVSKSSNLTREIRIRSEESSEFEILGASCSHKRILVSVEKPEPHNPAQGPMFIVKVTLDLEDAKFGEMIQDRVIVRTTSKQRPEVQIPVNATVSGEVILNVMTLNFGMLQPNREIPRFLTLTNTGQRALEILEIRNQLPNLSFETETLSAGKQYRIKAVFNSGESPEPLNGEIVIVTDHPEQEEIRVPVLGYVRGRS